jgi:hypothetical protein
MIFNNHLFQLVILIKLSKLGYLPTCMPFLTYLNLLTIYYDFF